MNAPLTTSCPPNLSIIEMIQVINRSYPTQLRRKILLPNNYCFACSHLASGSNFRSSNGMFFDNGIFEKCEHLLPTPYPTVVEHDGFGMNRPSSESSVNIVKDILKKTKQGSVGPADQSFVDGSRVFISKTLIAKEQSRAKVSVLSKTDTSSVSRDNALFVNANMQPNHHDEFEARSRAEFHKEKEKETDKFYLPQIGPGQINIHVVTKATRQINEMAKLDISKFQRGARSLMFAEESTEEELSLAATVDSGHLSYHHRSSEENVPVIGFDALCKPRSRENSFEFLQQNRSVVSREETLMTSESSFLIERIASGKWCECIDVDLNNLLCSECDCVELHDKTCSLSRSNSRLGLCPSCGKPVRRPMRIDRASRESSISRRETERRMTCSRESLDRHSRPLIRSNYRNTMFNQDRKYSATGEDYMDVEAIIYDDDTYLSPEEDIDEEFEMRKRNAKPWPTYDPMIHKEAYDKALGEARSRRERKFQINAFHEEMRKSTVTKPFVFSYYRLLPFITKHDIGFQSLANPEDNKCLKIKNGMKHIFGDVKVDDYYPRAINGKNVKKKISQKPKSNDIRTQMQVTIHTPI